MRKYFRTSAAYRVRIALNLKGLPYHYVPAHLTLDHANAPLPDNHGTHINDALAMIDYLDEKFPASPLMPVSAQARARVRHIALALTCDIHPLQNLRILKYLMGKLGASEAVKVDGIRHWIQLGLETLEADLASAPDRGLFCVGDRPTIADCALVPQLFSALGFGLDLTPYPVLQSIYATCEAMPEFIDAHPARHGSST